MDLTTKTNDETEWERTYSFRAIRAIPIMDNGCGPGQLMSDPPEKYLCSWGICPTSLTRSGWALYRATELDKCPEHPRLCNSHHLMLYLMDVNFSQNAPRKLNFDNPPEAVYKATSIGLAARRDNRGWYKQDITLVENHKEENSLEIIAENQEKQK